MKDPHELVRIIVDPRDASKDQHVPYWQLQHLVVSGKVIKDVTNNAWATRDGKPLNLKGLG